VPLAAHKQVGPSACLVFLGIEVDSQASQLRLPADQLTRLRTWKDLEFLVGLLNHACKVVRSGRAFLRRMLDLLHTRPQPSRGPAFIRLN